MLYRSLYDTLRYYPILYYTMLYYTWLYYTIYYTLYYDGLMGTASEQTKCLRDGLHGATRASVPTKEVEKLPQLTCPEASLG